MELIRTNSNHTDFITLVKLLDSDLALRDGEDHAFYAQFNKIDMLKHVVVAYKDNIPVACGAIKSFNTTTVEVKRMYTTVSSRGQGLAFVVLTELEQWATELNYTYCVLETGIKQPEAIALYYKKGYNLIANYGQYQGIENSKCFKKHLI
ncbi:GNAT family N-acetyltransferase [uncultured Formosa sp.]|uniref:GNAT family N-acetyltransferase n=1 Tax=uncultured Formosa sp. TaxID=255435 RepID=UPI0026037FCC|nr:GNAT family N-acetyltransferase [uncultured Formosa sp.]